LMVWYAAEPVVELDMPRALTMAEGSKLPRFFQFTVRRIAAVDRNVLRLAIYEMLYRDDIPPVVSINEAIELAKKFGGAESGRFVNGILDQVRKQLTRPAREAVTPSGSSNPERPLCQIEDSAMGRTRTVADGRLVAKNRKPSSRRPRARARCGLH